MWSLRLRRWWFAVLRNLECELRMWLDAHDVCEICKKDTVDTVCVSCGRRICPEHDSLYYEDETLCAECRKQITPEQEEADRIEARDEACENSSCHKPGCPCTRKHSAHSEECQCICEEWVCDKVNCTPTGYTGTEVSL